MGRGARNNDATTAAARASAEDIRLSLRNRSVRPDGRGPAWADSAYAAARQLIRDRPADQISNGVSVWTNSAGHAHREEDLPAVVVEPAATAVIEGLKDEAMIARLDGGGSIWARDGVPHRDYGPAVETAAGHVEYWRRGFRHRTDGPAVQRQSADGSVYEEYYVDGLLHRDDGPAVIGPDTGGEWYVEGRRHRDGDLPAVIRRDGSQQWFVDGELHRDGDQPAAIDANGTRQWAKHGKTHRDGDLPAVEHHSGRRDYFRDGKRHRDGGQPARVYVNGKREWWVAGKRHRADGPAVVDAAGNETFYWQGKKVDAAEHAALRLRAAA